jgi:hypothetical protein
MKKLKKSMVKYLVAGRSEAKIPPKAGLLLTGYPGEPPGFPLRSNWLYLVDAGCALLIAC